jgi:type VI protein secretion system component VasA
MDDLLPYYERELQVFRRCTREFSDRFPKMKGDPLIEGKRCADSDVTRLIRDHTARDRAAVEGAFAAAAAPAPATKGAAR